MDRVYDAANRDEIDPNLLIVDAVEAAYPAPKLSKKDLAELFRRWRNDPMTAEEKQQLDDLYSKFLEFIEGRSGRR